MPCVVKPTIFAFRVVHARFVSMLHGGRVRLYAFRMANVDSSLDDTDCEVAFYCSQSTSKQSSKGISDLTCKELIKYLEKWGLSEAICKVLKGL